MWRFLRSEMLVILGLTEDANRTDAEIASLYNMNKGTIASVRRRLLDAGAMFYVNVPSFNKLGCELMCHHMGSTDPGVPADVKTRNYLEFINETPEVYFSIIGGNSISMFSSFKDATDLETFAQRHGRFFSGERRLSRAKLDTVSFPFAMTMGTFETNFAPMVHRFFELDVPAPKPKHLKSVSTSRPDLSDTEKRTLVALVESPQATDKQLAAGLKLSRQAVTRVRNKLSEEGYFTKVCLPRLYKWGFEIYAVAHAKFSMEYTWTDRLKAQPSFPIDLSFMTYSKADESVSNYMVSRYQEYAESLEDVLSWYHREKVFDESPSIGVFSLERCTELRFFDYGPAVRRLLLPGQAPAR